MARGLSEKQEKFCVAYIKDGNATKAYRIAGYGKRMKPKTVNEAASRLLKNSNISTRIQALRSAMEKRTVVTLASHLLDLKELRDLAKKDKQFSAAISAEAYRGKAAGLYTQGGGAPLDDAPSGEVGDVVTIDQARRVAFVLQAGMRITMISSTAVST